MPQTQRSPTTPVTPLPLALPDPCAPPGVTSFCVQIVDELSGGEAELCVKIVVPRDETVRFFIPLEPATPDKDAACPDDATLAQLAADYGATVKAQPGVLDLKVLGVTCTWIVSRLHAETCASRGQWFGVGRAGWAFACTWPNPCQPR